MWKDTPGHVRAFRTRWDQESGVSAEQDGGRQVEGGEAQEESG